MKKTLGWISREVEGFLLVKFKSPCQLSFYRFSLTLELGQTSVHLLAAMQISGGNTAELLENYIHALLTEIPARVNA